MVNLSRFAFLLAAPLCQKEGPSRWNHAAVYWGAWCLLVSPMASAQAPGSAWVYPSPGGNLLYQLDERGQRITDFSNCGYQGGTEPLPDVVSLIPKERWIYLDPGDGDDLARIQTAVNTVSGMTPDANGWRGVIFLNAGEYQLGNTLSIEASGVVLKGAGDSPDNGTRMRATGAKQYSLIHVTGSGSRSTVSSTTHSLTQKLIPAGTRTFEVDSTSKLSVGYSVVIKRPSTAKWIQDIGMDQLGPTSGGAVDDIPWAANSKDLYFERQITRIDGNWITIDVPLPQTFESIYGGGQIWRYTWSTRINQVGIEDLYGFSDYISSTDEAHGWQFIVISKAQDSWVRNITAQYFGYSAVTVSDGSKRLTIADSQCLDPISLIDGGRRYSFNNEGGEMILFVNNFARKGRHDFVFGSLVPGPNAFVHGLAETVYADSGPHHRWSVGGLFDNIQITGNELNAQNRGNLGTGHGWSGAYMAVWNSAARTFRVRNPPTARNWLIGSVGAIGASSYPVGEDPAGTYDNSGTAAKQVYPRSLYYGQLQQRMKWPDSMFQEIWLGDIDQHTSTGGTGEIMNCNATWLTQVDALDPLPADSRFDSLVGNKHTAFTFDFTVDPGCTVVAASLTVSLRSINSLADYDVIRLDSTANALPYSTLAWTPLPTTTPGVRTLEVDPSILADGRLNVALGPDSAVDFALLNIQVQKLQPITQTIVLQPTADAYVRAGTYADSNFGTGTTLQTKDKTVGSLNRQAFIRWDINGLRGKLIHAKVRLAGTGSGQIANENCAALVSDDTWGEDEITFTNKPAAGKFFAQWLPVTGQASEFIVTPQVSDALGNDGKLSLCVASPDDFGSLGYVSYASRESTTTENRPQLILTFENEAPTIGALPDQTIDYLSDTGALPLAISDGLTPLSSLTLTGTSSDTALIPNANIQFGTTESGRTVKITPLSGKTGSCSITITVSDGTFTASDSFIVTVIKGSDPPLASEGTAVTRHNQAIDIDLWTLTQDNDTPDTELFFTVQQAATGAVFLLADGHTARFNSPAGFKGLADFSYTVSDPGKDPRRLLHYNFELPDSTSVSTATDRSGASRNGSIIKTGNGNFSFTNDVPLPILNNRSLQNAVPDSSSAVRITRSLTTTERNLSDADWTFAAWFKRASTLDDDFIFYIGDSDGNGGGGDELQLYGPTGSESVRLRHWNSSNLSDIDLTATPPATSGKWHHAAITFSRSGSQTGVVRFYVDGIPVASPVTLTWALKQASPLVFGGHNSTGTSYINRSFNGQLDDIVLFNEALSESEIARLTSSGVTHFSGRNSGNKVTVTVLNDPPILGYLPDVVIDQNGNTGPLSLVVSDRESPASELSLTARSSDSGLIPDQNITLAGSGSNRFLTITPAAGRSGSCLVEVTASDGFQSASQTFGITVRPPVASYATWAVAKNLDQEAAAFTADPDHDGIPNGIEFVIGGEPNPAQPDSPSHDLLPAVVVNASDFVFNFKRTHDSIYLDPACEFGSTPSGPWTRAIDGLNSTIQVTAGTSNDTVYVKIPRGNTGKLFARLVVIQSTP
jgi:hypothetical protein